MSPSSHQSLSAQLVKPRVIAVLGFAIWGMGHGSFAGPLDYFKNGFKVGPNYKAPTVLIAAGWIDDRDPRVVSKPLDRAAWWEVFNDPVLNRLQSSMIAQSMTLKAAYLRVEQARAMRDYTVGTLFPQKQGLDGDFVYQRVFDKTTKLQVPENLPIDSTFNSSIRDVRAGGLNLSAAWELDFWGKYRRLVEASDATLDAAVSSSDATMMVLTAELAKTYIDYRATQEQLTQFDADLALLNSVSGIIRKHADATTTSVTAQVADSTGTMNLFLPTSDGSLESSHILTARSQIVAKKLAFEGILRAQENALSHLVGSPVGELRLGKRGIPKPPARVCVGIPRDLLRHRPDVVAAERVVAAESARIGVAEADFYPHISIFGTLASSTKNLDDLLKSNSNTGTLGAAVSWQLLDYGRTSNRRRAQIARFEEAVAQYTDTVSKANMEAENAIFTFIKSGEVVAEYNKALRTFGVTVQGTLTTFDRANSNFDRVYSLLALAPSHSAIAARASHSRSLVEVYKAVGTGWPTGAVRTR